MPIEVNKIIQGLWIGSELSVMEQLSISSFLLNGHEYHLYVYNDLKYIPAGTVVMDASEILPSSRIFQYKCRPSYAGFANFFRYKLLLKRGGWWADTDTICLKPFDFPGEYVFSSEINHKGREVVNAGAIKAPPASDVMAYAWDVCQRKNPARLVWGETGPGLMAKAVIRFGLEKYKMSHKAFCPIDYEEWRKVLQPGFELLFDERTYAIHLWNEMWRAAGQDKNAQYDQTCLYEKLKRTYSPITGSARDAGSLKPVETNTACRLPPERSRS
jgi:mannosyltransferase OCH1-like enzyme